jgi:hypothetical protein
VQARDIAMVDRQDRYFPPLAASPPVAAMARGKNPLSWWAHYLRNGLLVCGSGY